MQALLRLKTFLRKPCKSWTLISLKTFLRKPCKSWNIISLKTFLRKLCKFWTLISLKTFLRKLCKLLPSTYLPKEQLYRISAKSNNICPLYSRLLVRFRAKNGSPGSKNQNFPKWKKTSRSIFSKNKCTNFQPNPSNFGLSWPLGRFLIHFVPKTRTQGPKIKILKK